MRFLAAPRVWLKRPFTLRHRAPRRATVLKFARTANGSERVPKVSIEVAFVLQSASFTAQEIPDRDHGRLVWSQSFPQLWKKLWKITHFEGQP
jgi:hypothetical protein